MLHRLSILGLGLYLTGVCGCSSPSADPPPDAFLGSWSCKFQTQVTFTVPDAAPPLNVMMPFIDVITAGDKPGDVVVTSTDEAGVMCPLHFAVSGSVATLAGTQTCMEASGLTDTYTRGTLTFSGKDHWDADVLFTISGTTTTGVAFQGVAPFKAQCDRS